MDWLKAAGTTFISPWDRLFKDTVTINSLLFDKFLIITIYQLQVTQSF